ncbi:hypothetical protein PybrP1_003331 [[Pythium] brassicae (nom. inval.)]|nr:hypothetical protein PybrP1_003331 [[Pythium] brassicae (nom. inval.)]
MVQNHLQILCAVAAGDERCRARRRLVYEMVETAEWRAIMRSRHYLTASCLVTPSDSAWATLYERGSDLNFLNKTSLTRRGLFVRGVESRAHANSRAVLYRSVFHKLLARFAAFYPIKTWRPRGGKPPKIRLHHQVLDILLLY